MRVFTDKDNKTHLLKGIKTVGSLLSHLNIHPDTVIVAKNNKLVCEDEILCDSDDIKILNVVSGG